MHIAHLLSGRHVCAPNKLILFLPQKQCTSERQAFLSPLSRHGNRSSEKGCDLPKARQYSRGSSEEIISALSQ